MRVAEIGAIAKLADPTDTSAFDRALREGPEETRWPVARGLGRINDPAVIPLLLDVLTSAPQSYLRSEAAEALGKTKDPAAVAPLVAALQDPGFWVGQRAALALGELGDPGAVAPLCALLHNLSPSFP